MFTVIISEKGGEQRRMDFDKPEVTIGRVQGNDIILPKGNVSKRHSRIVLKDGKFIIVDLKSTNGTYVNGRKITSPLVLKDSDKVYIGDFILTVEDSGLGTGSSPPHQTATPIPPPAPPTGVYGDTGTPAQGAQSLVSNPPPVPKRASGGPPPVPGRRSEPTRDVEELSADEGLDMPPAPPPPPRGARSSPPPREPAPTRDLQREGNSPTRDLHNAAGAASAAAAGAGGAGHAPASLREPPTPSALRDPPASHSAPAAPTPSYAATPFVAPAPAYAATAARESAAARAAASAGHRPESAASAAAKPAPVEAPPRRAAPEPRPRATLKSFDAPVPIDAPARPRTAELVREIHDRVAAQLDLGRIPVEKLAEEALWQRAETAVCDLVEQLEADGNVPAGTDQDSLIKDALNELLGVGPLEDLLADEEVTDVLVDRADAILVERGGRLVASDKVFSSESALRKAIDRLLAQAGRKLDSHTPLVDARLAGGTRVVAALPPIAVRGPCLTVRKPRRSGGTLEDWVRAGSMSPQMAQFLGTAVAARKNLVVCGGAAAGKSGLVSALAAAIPAHERVVSVEEVAELAIGHDHWVALEARLPEEGRPGVAFVDVVRAALRMRPDRLVVGEVRGVETLEVLAALAASAEGGVIAVGGDSSAAALARLETLSRLAAPEASARGLRELVAHAAHIVVTVARFSDGVRRVVSIGEVTGPQGEGYAVRELFSFQIQIQGQGEGGVRGRFAGTGVVPRFYEQLQARGEAADASVFR